MYGELVKHQQTTVTTHRPTTPITNAVRTLINKRPTRKALDPVMPELPTAAQTAHSREP